MGTTRYASVLGLGFGDCGKGHFVDALTRRWHAHTVVRFSGGAQAGHNVVTAAEAGAPAQHHTFAQFGAGTLVPGTRTLLLDPMVVHPTALLVEAEVLGRLGVPEALARLTIDAQCRVTTPFHQAAGRLREHLRGAAAHGTCGVGVGETVRHSLEHPEQTLRYTELASSGAAQAKAVLEKLQTIRQALWTELAHHGGADRDPIAAAELRVLDDETLASRWFGQAQALARQCDPQPAEAIRERLQEPGVVLFEGAQGILLDEWLGFHPHTSWSSVTTSAVEEVAHRFGIAEAIEHYGVLRSYLTRHGAGPLPTHDEELDALLPEPHNSSGGWQGKFRRGHPDAVLLRYALEAVGELSGLLVSHLDVFERGVRLRWCETYTDPASTLTSPALARIPVHRDQDLARQTKLTELLQRVRPQYAAEPMASADGFLDRLASVCEVPVILRSFGATDGEIRTA